MHCTARHAARRAHNGTTVARRSLHQMPLLRVPNAESDGLPPLFSAGGYRQAWTEYQGHVIDGLNRVSADTDYAHMSLVKVIAQTARTARLAPVYNHAALAFSNHFFFDALRTDASASGQAGQQAVVPQALLRRIDADLGGMEMLRDHIRAVAKAMVGSGWVWLVLDGQGSLRVLATYNSGTPFDMSRAQRTDGNSADTPDAAVDAAADAGAGADASSESTGLTGQANGTALYKATQRPYSLSPVACLSVWEHSYLYDFGVAGKGKYVDAWFDALDWDRVHGRMAEAEAAAASGAERRPAFDQL